MDKIMFEGVDEEGEEEEEKGEKTPKCAVSILSCDSFGRESFLTGKIA